MTTGMLDQLRSALGNMKAGVSGVTGSTGSTEAAASSHQSMVVDSRAAKLTVAGYEVEGVSISGQETCIIIPRCKVVFDSGRCPQRAVMQQTLLLTHGHLDHIGGIPFHVASRNLNGMPPSKLVVPPAYEDGIRRLLDLHDELQGGTKAMEYELSPLPVGQELLLPGGYIARPFVTTHTIASQGYLLYSQRKKLRADLVGKSQEEIRDLRMAGHQVTETFEIPEVAFTGDTTAAFLEALNPPVCQQQQQQQQQQAPAAAAAAAAAGEAAAAAAGAAGQAALPVSTATAEELPDDGATPPAPSGHSLLDDVLRAKLLIMEMTFLDESVSVEQAREKGHMHIADFVANAHRFQNEAILLVHFSARYSRQHILDALDTHLPPALRARCVPLLNGYS